MTCYVKHRYIYNYLHISLLNSWPKYKYLKTAFKLIHAYGSRPLRSTEQGWSFRISSIIKRASIPAPSGNKKNIIVYLWQNIDYYFASDGPAIGFLNIDFWQIFKERVPQLSST